MVLVKILMRIGSPTKEEALVMMMASISSPGEEFPRQNLTARVQKGLNPGFRLETATLHPERLLMIFFPE